MGLSERYERNLKKLLNDKSICEPNRKLFKKFFEELEVKLKRQRGVAKLNDRIYKTLNGYIPKLRNVNTWFNNKDWFDLTPQDIRRVYNDLEDEKILNSKGTPFKDKQSYYNKIMKSKPFKMVDKDEIAREIIETTFKKGSEVRFITKKDFIKAVEFANTPQQKLILWLGFDVGENVSSLLQLKKKDCKKVFDEETKEPEYHIRLKEAILKTGRTPRTEPTLYNETANLLDIY